MKSFRKALALLLCSLLQYRTAHAGRTDLNSFETICGRAAKRDGGSRFYKKHLGGIYYANDISLVW